MDQSLLTPNTAMLYSCLDLNAFVSPAATFPSSNDPNDVFSRTFAEFHGIRSEDRPLTDPPYGRYLENNHSKRPYQPDLQCITPRSIIRADSDGCFQDMYTFDRLSLLPEAPSGSSCGQAPPENMATIEGLRKRYGPGQDPEGLTQQAYEGPQRSLGNAIPFAHSQVSNPSYQASSEVRPDRRRIGRPRKNMNEAAREQKRQHFLERNRIAAGKCRLRKKAKVENLGERSQRLQLENAFMKDTRDGYKQEVEELKRLLSIDCQCDRTISGWKFMGTTFEKAEQNLEESETAESVEGMRKDSGYEGMGADVESSKEDNGQEEWKEERHDAFSVYNSVP